MDGGMPVITYIYTYIRRPIAEIDNLVYNIFANKHGVRRMQIKPLLVCYKSYSDRF